MANYKKVIPFTLEYEGGLCNDEHDAGSWTNYGVSLTFAKSTKDLKLFDMNRDGKIDAADIKAMTKDRATEIFKKYFWDIYGLDDFNSDKKAFVFFDASVNHGSYGATRLLQKALNAIGANLVVDGRFGKLTLAALQEANEEKFIKSFQKIREEYYYDIVKRKPSQKVFLKGWLNRIKWIDRDLKKI